MTPCTKHLRIIGGHGNEAAKIKTSQNSMRRTIANIFLKTRMSKIDFVWVSSRSWLKVYELRTFTFIVSRFLRVLYGEFAMENVQEFELSSKNLTIWVSQAISHSKSRLICIKSAVFRSISPPSPAFFNSLFQKWNFTTKHEPRA